MRAFLSQIGRVSGLSAAVVRDNINGLVVLIGLGWLYVGLSAWSRALANSVVGGVVLVIGLCPYLLLLRKS